MTRYSFQPRDRIFVKVCEFSSNSKNMVINIGKNISKNLSSKYVRNVLIMLNNLLQIHLNFFKKRNSENSRSN